MWQSDTNRRWENCFLLGKWNSEIARVYYDDLGRIKSYWKETKDDGSSSIKRVFEDDYIFLPNPFQQGDIVAMAGTDKVGVVRKVISEFQSDKRKICLNKDY